MDKNELLEKMADVCDMIDAQSDMYLGDIMSDCMEAVSANNFVTAPLQLRKLGNILDKRGLFDLAEEVDALLPDILELKATTPNTNTTVETSLSAQKAYKVAMKLRDKYMCGEVDEKSFEYEKMKELEAMLKSGFMLPSENINMPNGVKNWWDFFEKGAGI